MAPMLGARKVVQGVQSARSNACFAGVRASPAHTMYHAPTHMAAEGWDRGWLPRKLRASNAPPPQGCVALISLAAHTLGGLPVDATLRPRSHSASSKASLRLDQGASSPSVGLGVGDRACVEAWEARSGYRAVQYLRRSLRCTTSSHHDVLYHCRKHPSAWANCRLDISSATNLLL